MTYFCSIERSVCGMKFYGVKLSDNFCQYLKADIFAMLRKYQRNDTDNSEANVASA